MPGSLPVSSVPATVAFEFPTGPGGDATYNFYRSTAKTPTIPTAQSIGKYPGYAAGGAGTPSVKGGTSHFTCSIAYMTLSGATNVLQHL